MTNVISLCDQCDWTSCFPGLYFFSKHQQAAEKRVEAGVPDNPAGGLLGQAKRGATEFTTSELHGAIACMLISAQPVFQQPASLKAAQTKAGTRRGGTIRAFLFRPCFPLVLQPECDDEQFQSLR